MTASRPPFRADHVGSLLRPPALKSLRLAVESGQAGPAGGHAAIAETLFNELPHDGFFLEVDDARSGDFSPLRYVPRNVRIVLGLVTTKVGHREAKDELAHDVWRGL